MYVITHVFALVCTAVLAAQPSMVFEGVETTLAETDDVQDLLIIGGKVTVRGIVRGHLFAVGSDVHIEPTAMVMKPGAVHGGSLTVAAGAVLPSSIDLRGARLIAPGIAEPAGGDRVEVALRETVIAIDRTPVGGLELSLMKAMLPFSRFTPPDGAGIERLAEWHPGLGLELKKTTATGEPVTLGGVAHLSFVSDNVLGSFQRGYRGARGAALLTAVRLRDEATSQALWTEIARIPESAVALSVRSELGDGAHWYFRHKKRNCMLWRRGSWFIAVETRISGEGASAAQERQFMQQVLSSLAERVPR